MLIAASTLKLRWLRWHMSGHSKWSTIKHQKAATDKKRADVFGKLGRAITIAAREGGSPDPVANARLRTAIDKAREFNMPADNIERAIGRGSGTAEGTALEAVTFDAVGPAAVALVIEGITDNRNRTVSEIRKILESHGGKLAGEGASRWAFKPAGILMVNPAQQQLPQDALELELIQAGAEDIHTREGVLEVIVPKEELFRIRTALAEKRIGVQETQIGWVPQQTVPLPEQNRHAFEQLIQNLEEHADVQTIWSNEA